MRRRAAPLPGRQALLRALPAMDELLERPDVRAAAARHGRDLVAALLRERLSDLRATIATGPDDAAALAATVARLGSWVAEAAAARTSSSLRPVVNATGVILHTNLGRALLSPEASRRMLEVAGAYTTLEYDVDRGARGSRGAHLDRIARLVFPGRGCHAVNNNAAAVLLALNTLAEGKEVVVSRGELVEIGGSFRIPDIMRKSGAVLREVGTTNRTRLSDYERALSPATGLLLKVHPSNYRIVGFTEGATLREVAALGRRRRVPVMFDQGSGAVADLKRFGIEGEPPVSDALDAGADIVCFSGDKLLGGPQAGVIVGHPDLVRRLRDNPLSRALRLDKTTYAALEATLLAYARGDATTALPAHRMIALTAAAIAARAERLVDAVQARAPGALTLELRPGRSVVGGGSAPDEGLPTTLVTVASPRLSARQIDDALRRESPPILARIERRRILIDLRTVLDAQDVLVADALVRVAAADAATAPAPIRR